MLTTGSNRTSAMAYMFKSWQTLPHGGQCDWCDSFVRVQKVSRKLTSLVWEKKEEIKKMVELCNYLGLNESRQKKVANKMIKEYNATKLQLCQQTEYFVRFPKSSRYIVRTKLLYFSDQL